jgi:hypothetical protein
VLADALRYALDPVTFALELLDFEPDPWQASVLRSTGKRTLLNCSRQSGKSTTTAVAALHQALYHPRSLVLLGSPSLRQSSELFKKVTDNLDRLDNRPHLLEDNKLSFTLDNGSRVVSLPGSEATIRGFSGPSLIIEDEASRVDDAFYFSTRPMLATSNGRLILMSTPFGKRGHFFEAWTNGGAEWERIEIDATQVPRITQEFLDTERAAIGDWWFSQEYMCQFVATMDQVFSYDLVMQAVTDEIQPLFGASA